MFLKTVLADGTAEQTVIREMKARAAGARGDIEQIVRGVMADVQERGWDAVVEYAEKFDGKAPYIVEPSVLDAAYDACDPKLISALEKAAANIRDYHEQMLVKSWEWKRSAGETLGQTVRGLARVGIYVPGGTAAYPSSVLMNAIPAKVAGVGELIMVTPPTENMSNEVLAAAKIAGVDKVIAIGGTQAIAALTYGAGFIPQVDKIVGPGNAYVTEAKRQVSQRLDGAAIDMPAGPSEVLVIADSGANPDFVASDLLSQAEHGPDSQVILLTPDADMGSRVAEAVERQLAALPRAETARVALSASRIIVARDLAQCVAISNQYGPEHLIIQTRQARELVDSITSAGSVFLGDWSPESAGDYASGTNHVLPTYGYTATCSSLGLADFQKRMTVQELSRDGFAALASTIEILAAAERLDAHKNAVTLRVAALKEQA